MINSRFIYFCLVLSRMHRVNIIRISGDYVHGNCPCSVMDEIATFALNEGYTVEFLPMESSDFKVSFAVSFCAF